ncbi:lytic murein transglycosylase [Parasulfitobacter algicola]|uniref:Lytic murein transglycosylase n=1 Tax=Parasulfitobacter algicola TaxID=2614809 RepID=A0ABX2IUL9_9RHOB|nr:lytic murein transglycosylase [Sulfitobacter algicola]NSX53976.1 lytic murein transglycosylase [Sulfitobacter algicola]
MRLSLATIFCFAITTAVTHANCGGSFNSFVTDLKKKARQAGHSSETVNRFFASVRQDPKVIRADRSQGVFKKNFIEFSRAVISANRLQNGQRNAQKYSKVFDRAQREYGVPSGVLLAFWALETDYGAVQGNFNTLNALVTLSHDCRRPQLFRPQIFAAIKLYERGEFDPARTTGAWAGEIGMVQMLPEDILTNGVDADGDGKVSLKTSPPDALMSGAKMLHDLGWRANEPWLQEITVPNTLDWSKTGFDTTITVDEWAKMGVRGRSGDLGSRNLQASVLLPMGKDGPAFLAYPNYTVYFEWNQSFIYVTTAAYFATRLSGAPPYDPRNPESGLNDTEMKMLQTKLRNRGHDVGKIDGILGRKTRAAVQAEQQRLGLPADAWPTRNLLQAL